MVRLMRFVALAGLLGVGTAFAVYPPAVKDDGKFFTKEGLEKADKKIRLLYEKYKKDVVIETLNSLTPEQLKQMEADGKTNYYVRLAGERSKALGLNGLYILVTKQPQYMEIYSDSETRRTMFREDDRKRISKAITARFKEKEFDAGLMDGLDAVEAVLMEGPAKKR